MNFKRYLIERSYGAYDSVPKRTKEITKEEALKLLETKCKKSLKGTPIYRGLTGLPSNYGYADPANSPMARISRNAEGNYYTLLMDNLPSWKGYPKRSKSFICSTDDMKASGYGDMYYVFPVNGAKIGVCSSGDVFHSFPQLHKYYPVLSYFNMSCQDIFKQYAHAEPQTYKELIEGLKKIQKKAEEWDAAGKIEEFGDYWGMFWYYAYTSMNGDMLKYINFMMSPRENHFLLKKAGYDLPDDNEVWTEGPCVFVSYDEVHRNKEFFGQL